MLKRLMSVILVLTLLCSTCVWGELLSFAAPKTINLYVSKEYKKSDPEYGKTKFKTMLDAYESVPYDNKDKYIVNVADGYYTDMQKLYAGDDGTYYQGLLLGNHGRSNVTFKSVSGDPEKCVIAWDGGTGYTGDLKNANIVNKCAFHINGNVGWKIKGFKFIGKNLRYCLHSECNTKTEALVENCVFEWYGNPDVVDGANTPTVGMGGSYDDHITFKNCVFTNYASELAVQWHDNMPYPAEQEKYNDTVLRFENCDFNNLSIMPRSTEPNRTEIFKTELVNCKNVNELIRNIGGKATENYWRVYLCNTKYQATSFEKNEMFEHDYSVKVVKPECNKRGYTSHTCRVCGDEYREKYTPALEHNYVEKTTRATLKEDGEIATVCTNCSRVKSSTRIYRPNEISLSKTEYVYNGKAKKPTVKVKDRKGEIIPSSNYSVSYADGRKKVGKYKATVKFKGNYSGSKALYFTIKPKKTSISSIRALSKGFSVKWKKQSPQVTGYQLQYATNKDFTKNKKTITVSKYSTVSQKVTGIKAKTKYYVRVRTYKIADGKKYYSSWSEVNSTTTK